MTRPTTPSPSAHRLSSALLGLVLPLVILAGAAALAWSWKDALPDPVATHWGSDGVDGFSSLAGALAGATGIGAGVVVLLWALSWCAGSATSARRMLNATTTWVAALLAVVLLGSLHLQKGLTDASEVGGIGAVMAAAFAIATVVAAVVYVLTPSGQHAPGAVAVPDDATRLPLGEDERAVWFQRARGGPGIVVGFVAAAATAVSAAATGDWWMLLVTAGLVVLVAAMFSWVVRVDEAGLRVRSAIGVPRTTIPLAQVVLASATTVRCFAEFGGWGWRTARDGRTGILLRSGEALEVTRTDGSVFVVTVDDAETAASLLNTLADRVRPPAPVE